MKKIYMIAICLVMVAGTVYAEMFDVKIGDDIGTVHEVLGEPDSYILVGNKAVVSYERGKIELISNKVSKVDFVSAAKAKELKLKTKKDNEKHHDYLVKEGTALKQRKLEDTTFLSQPIREQLDFWRSFRARYPMIDLAPVDVAGMASQAAEDSRQRKDKAREDELLQARWRLMAAEERAHQAELEASSRYTRYSRGYTSYLWPPQVIIPGRPCYPARPTPYNYNCIKPVSPFRPGGGTSIVGGSSGSRTTVSPHANRWPSHTPGVFPNTVR